MPLPATTAEATIASLRRDIALQIAKIARRTGDTQIAVARRLGVPQPTLSKINNGRVHDLSIELLLRVAICAGLVLTLQTGRDAKEAGAFISGIRSRSVRAVDSKLEKEARKSFQDSGKQLTPTERLEAFLQHNQLLAAFRQAGRAAEQKRVDQPPHTP
jgi:transcriptional regulator with XRE-family HTH domain